MISNPKKVALRISLLYCLGAGAWIIFSDRLVAALIPDLETVEHLQLYKGLAFVGITAVLLHALLWRALGRWGRELDERARAEERAQEAAQFTQSTIDALSSHVCVLDEKSTILTTNKAWQRFAELNPPVSHAVQAGANYLSACAAAGPEDKEAAAFAAGLRAVIRRERKGFEMEYSCHSPTEQRWFIARVTRFSGDGPLRVVVAHENITARKQTEESLKLFRVFVDKSNDAFEVIDPATGRFLDMSEKGCADLGYRREEVLALKVSDIDPTVQPAGWPQWVEKICNEKAVTFEGIHRRRDGTTFPVEVNIRWVQLDREYIVAAVRDITERRESQDKLLASEMRYRRLFETAKDGILILDAGTGMVVDVNPFLVELLGFTREAFLGKKVWELGFLKDIVAKQENFAELQRKEYIRYENLPLETAAGQRIAVEFVSNVYQVNSHKVIQCNIRDISERKRAEAQLQLQSTALKAAANAIVMTDAQGIIIWVNDAFTKVTGYSAEEAVGKNPRILKSGKHPCEFYEGMWKTILGGQVWHGEIHNKRKDGTAYVEETTITPVRDAQGKLTHFIAIKQDITEKLQMQLRFLRAQRLEGIGLLAGGIAHDLNNVLAPVLMGAGVLRAEPISDDAMEILAGMEAAAQHGADIVRQVLTFARGVEGERVAVQTRHLIKDMAKVIQSTFPKDIKLEQDVAANLWPVKGDATQIHQILLNLCVNARDAMPNGGVLRLEARNQILDERVASMIPDARPGNYVVVTVSDTGSGMAPAVIARIFEPFFTTKERGKGTGLGLSTTLGIVRSHGGFLQVKSEVGRGSQFIIFLPAASKETFLAPDQTSALEIPRGNGELILLVEDEKQIRDVAKDILARHGYRVLVAVDGMDGTVLFAKHSEDIALVLTDVLMPFMDGAGMVRAILRLNPAARILVSTGATIGGGVETKLEELKQMGVTTILLKPYSNTTLLREAHKALHPPAAAKPA